MNTENTLPPRTTAAIAVIADGTLECSCGNTPDSSGFDPCDTAGTIDETLIDASSERPVHYVCNGCGSISDAVA